MSVFLLLVVALLAIWIARNTTKSRQNERLIAELTARVFALEQEQRSKRTQMEQPAVPPVPVREPIPVVAEPAIAPPPAPIPKAAPSTRPPIPELPRQYPATSSRRSLLNLEETLGTNWLNKLGIVILVIGIALFLAYELTELGPVGKITVGYLVAAVMLAAGVFFERREQWRILARTGIAGGWALLYFTTYAMQHVEAARVLSSEGLDLALLMLVATGIVLHTLRYNSQAVTGLAFLLAFTTINVSHGNVYSLFAGAILAAGLATVALRRRWFEMELAGIAAAYLNHLLWLWPIIEPMHGRVVAFPGYLASSALLYSYWLIFRTSYVLRKANDAHQEQVSTFAAILNIALFLWVMGYQSVHPELAFQFFLIMGAAESLLGQLPITRRRRAAFIVLTTIGSCLLVAAIPYRYSGQELSSGWLAEAETLLLVGVFLREVVFRRLGLLVAFIAWLQMVVNGPVPVFSEYIRGSHSGLALLFGITALVFYADSQWIPRRWPEIVQNSLDRFCFNLLAHLAAILVGLLIWYEVQPVVVALGWSIAALILLEAGLRLRSPQLRLQAYVGFTASFLRIFIVNLNGTGTAGVFNARVYTIVPLAAAFYYAYDRLTRTSEESLTFERKRRIAGWLCLCGTVSLAALLRVEIEVDLVATAWAALALLLAALAWIIGRRIFLHHAILLAFGVLVVGIAHNLDEPASYGLGRFVSLGSAIALLFAVLPLARALRRPASETESATEMMALFSALDRRPDQVFFFAPFILLTALLAVELPSGMITLAWGLEAFAIFAVALWLKERSYRLSALALLLLCVLKIVFRDVWGLAPRDRYLTFIVLGLALLAVSYLYTRYREVLRQYL